MGSDLAVEEWFGSNEWRGKLTSLHAVKLTNVQTSLLQTKQQ